MNVDLLSILSALTAAVAKGISDQFLTNAIGKEVVHKTLDQIEGAVRKKISSHAVDIENIGKRVVNEIKLPDPKIRLSDEQLHEVKRVVSLTLAECSFNRDMVIKSRLEPTLLAYEIQKSSGISITNLSTDQQTI